jgi:hypothetical protein
LAYLRTKTLNGVEYDYLVKSVREGKKVHQVFVCDIGKHPPGEGVTPSQDSSCPSGFRPLGGADARTRCVSLLYDLGCQRVLFNLRSKLRHGAVHTLRHPLTGELVITKVCLHREASLQAICHEVGHVLDSVLQIAAPLSGSLSPAFATHTAALRKVADYTCVDQATGSPQFLRQLRRRAPSSERERATRQLERYYETYVYRADELFARLVSVSLTEPAKARAMAPGAYAWLMETLHGHGRIRHALTAAGLWAT